MKYFGTDGVRGPAGREPLMPEAILRMGRLLGQQSRGPVVVGRDTRESGPWILAALTSGILSAGKDVCDLGVCPTPVVSRVTGRMARGFGVVISASHNPSRDNGIKILRPNGFKATAALESKLETALDGTAVFKKISQGGTWHDCRDLVDEDQAKLLKSYPSLDLRGLKLVVDTAQGAAFQLAPEALLEKGADVIQMGGDPDGRNINRRCGSTHLGPLCQKVVETQADMGFAFDGDADRCLMVNCDGQVLDGDAMLAILARHAKKRRLAGCQKLVGTVMTNQGLEDYLKRLGVRLSRTPVGDKYVVERMRRHEAALGGENSGHLIMKRRGLVGDGLATALNVLEALQASHFDVSEAMAGYQAYPQVLINIPVKRKKPFDSIPQVKRAAQEVKHDLKGQGRLLLRYSGTENLARVMVEAKTSGLARTAAGELATIIRQSLGER